MMWNTGTYLQSICHIFCQILNKVEKNYTAGKINPSWDDYKHKYNG